MANPSQPAPARGGNDWFFWIMTVIFLFSLPPVGILMLVVKLASGTRRGPRKRHPYDLQQERQEPLGARTVQMGRSQPAAGRPQAASAPDALAKRALRARRLTILGGVLSAIFGFASLLSVTSSLWILTLPDITWFLEEVMANLCGLCGGLGCLWAGLRKRRQVRRFRKYLAMIGARSTVSVSSLSSAMGSSPAKVRDELEDMLDAGLFPAGYLDYGNDRLVVRGDGLADPPPKPEPPPQTVDPAGEMQDAVLAEIRAINDQIDDPKLSAQIDRVGTITAKVFDYQRAHPDRSAQLHSFLNYYLPTTLKILRAYAQLEDQDVDGENISAAMERIEGMMDKVVEGFEKQLDQLFQGDALDITSDVEVLEQMLAKDGLSSGQGLRLGG